MELDYHRYICDQHRLSHQPQGYNHQYHILDMSQSQLSFFLYIRILYDHSLLPYGLHVKHSQVFHWLLDYIRCHQYLEIYILSYQILRLYYSQKQTGLCQSVTFLGYLLFLFCSLVPEPSISKQSSLLSYTKDYNPGRMSTLVSFQLQCPLPRNTHRK